MKNLNKGLFPTSFVLCICCLYSYLANAQATISNLNYSGKRPIDTSTLASNWWTPHCIVSDDAKYSFSYLIGNSSSGNTSGILNQVNNGKTTEIKNINGKISPHFVKNGNELIFIKGKDSLCSINVLSGFYHNFAQASNFLIRKISGTEWLFFKTVNNELHILNLNSKKLTIFSGVSDFSIIENQHYPWISYTKYSEKQAIHLFSNASGKSYDFVHVTGYYLADNSNALILNSGHRNFIWIDLTNEVKKTIFSDLSVGKYVFDGKGKQFAFVNQSTSDTTIECFNWDLKNSTSIISKQTLKSVLPGSINRLTFNKDGAFLLLTSFVSPANNTYETRINGAGITVWNYMDGHVPDGPAASKDFAVAINLVTKRIVPIANDTLKIELPRNFNHFLLASNWRPMNFFYNKDHIPENYLVEIKTGKKVPIVKNGGICSISPDEKYVIYWDEGSLNWFSYEISSGIKRNLTDKIPFSFYDDYSRKIGHFNSVLTYGQAGWANNDQRIYFYDKYDLWEIDPKGVVPSTCITWGVGRKNGLVLNLIDFVQKRSANGETIEPRKMHVFSVFNPKTKESGFWMANSPTDLPMLLPYAMGEILRYDNIENNNAKRPDCTIERIGKTERYIITRQSANQFPNYFITSDFKTYRPLTDFQPQRQYNWLTAELINWTLPDGSTNQGILYKPENFDPTKKYPVLFDYYQGRSDEFHLFRNPRYIADRINIPYFVSNGYMVFVPDIYNRKGENSENVVDVIISARKYLIEKPYVDSLRLGLQGHSFGGWETNVLVTHTQNLFAAACTAAGPSDLISNFSLFNHYTYSNQGYYEYSGQHSPYGVGATPWTRLDLYSKDSPVLFAGYVTTPLLIIHGAKDNAVAISQGKEMFWALKRAGKKTWLLEYTNGRHSLDGADAKDLTIRMKQFFDHYLMNASAPKWMTNPVQANGWQEKVGYELNPPGVEP